MKFPGWGYWRAAPERTGNERLRVALIRACANRGRDISSDSPHPRSRSDIKWGIGDRRWEMAEDNLFAPFIPSSLDCFPILDPPFRITSYWFPWLK